jgi:hypothetical protein
MNTVLFILLVLTLIAGLPATTTAQSILSRGVGAKDLSLPLFGIDKNAPAATVKISQVGIEAQKRGFLRIGLLPQAAAQDVDLIFTKKDPTALADLAATFRVIAQTEVIVLHSLAVFAPDQEQPVLRAALARVDGDDVWELEKVSLRGGIHAARARLKTSGKNAGELTFDGGGTAQKTQLLP